MTFDVFLKDPSGCRREGERQKRQSGNLQGTSKEEVVAVQTRLTAVEGMKLGFWKYFKGNTDKILRCGMREKGIKGSCCVFGLGNWKDRIIIS